LKVFTEAEIERDRSEARRKWQLDYNTGMKVARMEGREEGRLEGREEGRQFGIRIGMIHFYEQFLNRPETPDEQLAGMSLEDLSRLAADLEEHVLKQCGEILNSPQWPRLS
jgi:flagellar biosynthesis/type III secretory pathway protein FliH